MDAYIGTEQYGSGSDAYPSATHDISRVNYHVKHLESFAQALEEVRLLSNFLLFSLASSARI